MPSRAEWNKRPGRSLGVRPSLRFAIYARDKFDCVWCRGVFTQHLDGEGLVLDHVIPKSKGGKDAPGNLITACVRCNAARQDRTVADFARWQLQNIIRVNVNGVCIATRGEARIGRHPIEARRRSQRVYKAIRKPLNRELGRWLARLAGRRL